MSAYPSLIAIDEMLLQSGMVLTSGSAYAFTLRLLLLHEENIVVREAGAVFYNTYIVRDGIN